MSAPPAKKQKFQNRKKFYQPNRKQYLEAGHKGFIATCNFNEKDCVRECYNVLNEFANDLYGPEELDIVPNEGCKSTGKPIETTVVEETTDDIADELHKQIEAARQNAKFLAKRRFQCVDTGATNCVFIKTSILDPVTMADHIVRNIAETKKQKTRFLLRLVPVEIVCKANEKDIVNSAGQLCDKYFLTGPTTFSIVFNKRFNNDVNKDSLIHEIADLIHAKNVNHKVDLKHAKKSLIVEVIKGLCCLSVVNDYLAMKKYNLVELAKANQDYDKEASKPPKEDKNILGNEKADDDSEQTVNSNVNDKDENKNM